MPPVFHFRKEDRHLLKINIFDAQIDNGAGAVSRSDKVVDQRPISPFHPPIGFRLLKKFRDLGVGIRLFDRIVFLHQLDGEKLHILPLCAELEEDPQTADTGILTRAVLAKTVAVLIFAGILLIATVFLTAKATEIKYSINSTMRQNAALQKEIDVLEVKIGSANSIESIEQYATEKLGMRYPKAGQSIYLTIDRAANKDLVQRIKEKAYRE